MSDYLLAGRYQLTSRIAAGGMGEVWRGQDNLLGRAVAVKLLPTGRAGDEAFLARFRAEARYAASLSHAGIARVYDYGESAEFGGAYLIMELVDGEPLSAILTRAGRLPADATLDIVSQAARALDVAHQAGIVHRDIKPGNLLVAAGGTTKITDFGIATVVQGQASHLTETGMVMGTAMYVSPEQATGAKVTASSDIYSLGVVAYECLAGQTPFTGREPLAIAFAHKHEPVPPLPADVPPQVADLVYHMLAKTPEERPPSARAVADRADVLREALALGDPVALGYAAPSGEGLTDATLLAGTGATTSAFAGARPGPGVTRMDMPPSGYGPDDDGYGSGRDEDPGARRRRQLVTAGATTALCVAAAAVGLYLTGHMNSSQDGKNTGSTLQHVSSPASKPPSVISSKSYTSKPTPSHTVKQLAPSTSAPPSTQPAVSPTPKPTKKASPTSSASASGSASASASGSGLPTTTATPTQTTSSPSS